MSEITARGPHMSMRTRLNISQATACLRRSREGICRTDVFAPRICFATPRSYRSKGVADVLSARHLLKHSRQARAVWVPCRAWRMILLSSVGEMRALLAHDPANGLLQYEVLPRGQRTSAVHSVERGASARFIVSLFRLWASLKIARPC